MFCIQTDTLINWLNVDGEVLFNEWKLCYILFFHSFYSVSRFKAYECCVNFTLHVDLKFEIQATISWNNNNNKEKRKNWSVLWFGISDKDNYSLFCYYYFDSPLHFTDSVVFLLFFSIVSPSLSHSLELKYSNGKYACINFNCQLHF